MNKELSRRRFLLGAAKAVTVVSAGVVGASWVKREGLLPPSCRSLYRLPEAMTYATQRLLLRDQTLAREFAREAISRDFPAIGTIRPKDPLYQRAATEDFRAWRLNIDGLVIRPTQLSLTELRSFPARTQITQHVCQEGWSAVGEWTGVPLWRVLNLVGVRSQARYVVYYSVDGWWDSIDLNDAFHPQTIIAYDMNGQRIPMSHGAPLRLRVERQLGYKSLKFLTRISLADSLEGLGNGKGSDGSRLGYSWYAGI